MQKAAYAAITTIVFMLALTSAPAFGQPTETPQLEEHDPVEEGVDAPEAAEEQTSKPAKEGGEKKPPDKELSWLEKNGMILFMVGGVVLLFVFMGRGGRKKEAARKQMLGELKKGDKVTTIGGIIGNVVEVREDEITVKVDESTRMKFSRRAISHVNDGEKRDGAEKK